MGLQKVDLAELKKAIAWIEANSKDIKITVEIFDNKFLMKCSDKVESSVVIELTETMQPKITKTDILR